MPYDVLRFAKVAANPIGAIQIPSDHNTLFVDYPYDAACRKAIDPQRVLKAFKLGAHGENALQSPLLIFYRITDSDNELSAPACAHNLADREPFARQYLLEICPVASIGNTGCRQRFSNICAIRGKKQDVIDQFGQFEPDLPEQHIVCRYINWICRNGPTESRQ
ncbi:MAG TPA: hypothetical protein VK148_11025 [Xanthobacteraceae bacterium]|nr:hypothetical protein [Xanthobacteraceae bacterium]